MSRSARPGFFITLEGIDGAGKSSHLDGIEAALKAQGRVVVRSREPGGTALAETLRTLILTEPMDTLTESLLVFAARREHLLQVIAPALARGDVVLCDRFTDATFAYQGAGRGFDREVLSKLELLAQEGRAFQPLFSQNSEALLEPDLTLWFDLPPEVAAGRLTGARMPDKFESQPVEFFRRVSQGYRERAAAARFERIDADQPRDAVHTQVIEALRRRGVLT